MAEEAEAAAAEDIAPPAPKGPLIAALINTVAILGALGFFVYTHVLYERPKITEQGERKKLEEQKEKPKVGAVSALIGFEPLTVNIRPPLQETHPDTLHYLLMAFSLEIGDAAQGADVEALRPMIIDKVLSLVGRKRYNELVTVQGRYLLRTEIQDTVNELLTVSRGSRSTLVTNVYLSQFTVQ